MPTLDLIAGLGNPGREYEATRHNFGFLGVDALLRAWTPLGAPTLISSRKDPFELFKATAPGPQRMFLLKPLTYMNKSGEAVRRVLDYYHLDAANLLVLHDEMDLPLGRMRLKKGGGNAGHNGLRSTTAAIGNDYRRVRIGIGHPGDKALVHAYVLNDFGKPEQPWVEDLCTASADHAALLAAHDDTGFQNKVHLFMDARGHAAVKRLGEKSDG